ncbi:MAG TPA: tetratricopeptide repeat protein [Pyrinomonadaceae bacterium]|jgi:tetratricopeptide (TPR) repeat protein|nr:tetratricopeptide repeat protein [Pyrinomonadaceae bacterium]
MAVKNLVLAIAILFVTGMAVFAQPASGASSVKEDKAQLDALRRSGVEALYNLDYDKAQKEFKEIVRLYPTHPSGPQLLAARLWIKTLYESRRLQSSLYSSESFYSSGEDKVDPKIITEFRNLTREAKRLAEVRLKQNPKDIEALDWLAVIEGLKASFEEAVERRHFAALKDGDNAVDHHREVLKLDPTLIDAGLTVGLYEYVVGSLPLPIKVVAGITGFRGSKKKGLALIERVAQEGAWQRDDAKTLLIVLYTREKRYNEALNYARELSAKYPRNYLFRLEAADALVSQAEVERRNKNTEAAIKAEREAFATFDELLHDRSVRDTVSRALDLVHFKYGEVLLLASEGERAAKEFLAATKVEHAEPTLVTMAHLYAARAFDLAGKRDEALAQYREVLTRPDIYAAHDEAKKGLREPYRTELASSSL